MGQRARRSPISPRTWIIPSTDQAQVRTKTSELASRPQNDRTGGIPAVTSIRALQNAQSTLLLTGQGFQKPSPSPSVFLFRRKKQATEQVERNAQRWVQSVDSNSISIAFPRDVEYRFSGELAAWWRRVMALFLFRLVEV